MNRNEKIVSQVLFRSVFGLSSRKTSGRLEASIRAKREERGRIEEVYRDEIMSLAKDEHEKKEEKLGDRDIVLMKMRKAERRRKIKGRRMGK